MRDLFSRGIASNGDQTIFDAHFTATQRSTASPRPGLRCEKTIAYSSRQAELLAAEVVEELSAVLGALREPLTTFA